VLISTTNYNTPGQAIAYLFDGHNIQSLQNSAQLQGKGANLYYYNAETTFSPDTQTSAAFAFAQQKQNNPEGLSFSVNPYPYFQTTVVGDVNGDGLDDMVFLASNLLFDNNNTFIGPFGVEVARAYLFTGQSTSMPSELALNQARIIYQGNGLTNVQTSPALSFTNLGYGGTVLSQGAVAYYPLTETSGTVAHDTSNDGNNGTISASGVTLGASGPPQTGSYAYQFSVGQIPVTVPQLNTTPRAFNTVSFWMNWNGTNSVMPIGFSRYDLYFSNNGGSNPSFGFNTYSGDIYGISSVGMAGRWLFVTAVFNNGNVALNQLWIGGEQEHGIEQRIGTSVAPNITTAASISGDVTSGTEYAFQGSLADVAFFNQQLTATQIQAEFNALSVGTSVNDAG